MEGRCFFSSPRYQKFLTWIASLIQFYPEFEHRIRESLRAIVGPEVEKRVEIGLAKDGSGVGGVSLSFFCCPLG